MRRLTKEIVNERIADRGFKLVGEYVAASTKATFECAEGHQWGATPDSVMRGTGCPNCAGQVPPTKDVVNERIADRGLKMLGEYVSSHTKATFACAEGHQWEATPTNIQSGKGCPICNRSGRKANTLTTQIVNARIADRGLKMVSEYVTASTKATFECAEGHQWVTSSASVMGGNGCPSCAGQARLTTQIVNARIAERGIKMIGEYVNTKTKATFECAEGHQWDAAPASVVAICGCPTCANSGFDAAAPAIVYYLKIEADETYYKIGITNRTVELRFGVTDMKKITVLETVDFEVGADARAFEGDILKTYAKHRAEDVNVLTKGGNTELFTVDVLNLDPTPMTAH